MKTKIFISLLLLSVIVIKAQDRQIWVQAVGGGTALFVGVAVEIADISATVVSIYKENRYITLKSPLGNYLTTYVDESVESFDELNDGNVIHVRYTKALAIDVQLQ